MAHPRPLAALVVLLSCACAEVEMGTESGNPSAPAAELPNKPATPPLRPPEVGHASPNVSPTTAPSASEATAPGASSDGLLHPSNVTPSSSAVVNQVDPIGSGAEEHAAPNTPTDNGAVRPATASNECSDAGDAGCADAAP